ncbi:MAG TPA: hypothetical protein VGK97_07190 [Spongiibacteraceae bacterium]
MFHSITPKVALAALINALSLAALAAPAANSAYSTDPQNSYVEDATSKGIGQVNMITCLMSAMRPDALVNQGNYVALVDQSKCDPEMRSSAGNSGSTNDGAQAASYMTAIVNSSRTSNNDPMLAKIWIDDINQGNKTTIFVHTSAQQSPTTANPYGIFRIDFCGRGEDPQSAQLIPGCMMQGYLEGASDGLSYYQQENGNSTTALRLNAATTDSGSGRLSREESDNNNSQSQIFSFAYNHDYFLRDDQCFSRDANQADFSVWRYGLYDASSGERIVLSSGFPIEYTPNAGSTTYHGYLGYYGLSLPPEAMTALSAESNPVVQKVDYGVGGHEPTHTNFSVVKAAGKLTKYTRKTRTLAQVDKIKLNVFVNDVSGFFSGAMPNVQYEVYWDNAAGTFKVDAQMNCDNGGCHSTSLPQEQAVAASFWANRGGLQGWSQSLGGEVFIDLHGVSGAIDANVITVVYRMQDLVYPSDMPAQLYCLRDCPTMASINSYFAPDSSAQSPFLLANNFGATVPGNEQVYTTNISSALLLDAQSQAVVFTDSSALQQRPQFQSGIRSGRLFTAADLSGIACDDQPANYCEYKVNSLDVYYVWETGSNSWNQFAAVKDTGGNFTHFDAPLQLAYSVPNDAAKYGEYAGKSLVLQYGGFGDLWGVPGQCVSHITNAPVSCDQQDARYVSAFAIRAGEQVSDEHHTYLVKWLEREIRFAKKDVSDGIACAGLAAPSADSVTLPTVANLKDTSDPASGTFYIGAKPSLSDAPRVVHGDVKF